MTLTMSQMTCSLYAQNAQQLSAIPFRLSEGTVSRGNVYSAGNQIEVALPSVTTDEASEQFDFTISHDTLQLHYIKSHGFGFIAPVTGPAEIPPVVPVFTARLFRANDERPIDVILETVALDDADTLSYVIGTDIVRVEINAMAVTPEHEENNTLPLENPLVINVSPQKNPVTSLNTSELVERDISFKDAESGETTSKSYLVLLPTNLRSLTSVSGREVRAYYHNPDAGNLDVAGYVGFQLNGTRLHVYNMAKNRLGFAAGREKFNPTVMDEPPQFVLVYGAHYLVIDASDLTMTDAAEFELPFSPDSIEVYCGDEKMYAHYAGGKPLRLDNSRSLTSAPSTNLPEKLLIRSVRANEEQKASGKITLAYLSHTGFSGRSGAFTFEWVGPTRLAIAHHGPTKSTAEAKPDFMPAFDIAIGDKLFNLQLPPEVFAKGPAYADFDAVPETDSLHIGVAAGFNAAYFPKRSARLATLQVGPLEGCSDGFETP